MAGDGGVEFGWLEVRIGGDAVVEGGEHRDARVRGTCGWEGAEGGGGVEYRLAIDANCEFRILSEGKA